MSGQIQLPDCFMRRSRLFAILICVLWCIPSNSLAQDGQLGQLEREKQKQSYYSGAQANVPMALQGTGSSTTGLRSVLSTTDQAAGPAGNNADAATSDRVALGELLSANPSDWTSNEGLAGSLRVLLTVSVLSVAPAILLMTTCYVRIVVVLGLLRQALGTGQLPSTQIITSISLFMTMFVMMPVWTMVYDEAIQPYTAPDSTITAEAAWQAAAKPVRGFMTRQIELVGNEDDVHLFYSYYNSGGTPASSWDQIPIQVLLPAYVLSELKTAFLMGFMIFLPFLIIDLVVSTVTVSMGMMMLPPAMISLPFKLLLFVLVDGWHLVVGMLLESFGPIT